MKVNHATGLLMFTGLALLISLAACSPTKYIIKGRVVDAKTQQPIKGAALAIRWLADTSAQAPAKTDTFDAFQALSDDEGVFQMPQYPDKKYILGVYKGGYVCWSSRDIFLADPGAANPDQYRKRKGHQLANNMEIELEPFKKEYPRDLHAGFTVMVAGECTITHDGPFHRAIEAEYRLWQKNLREDFQENLGKK